MAASQPVSVVETSPGDTTTLRTGCCVAEVQIFDLSLSPLHISLLVYLTWPPIYLCQMSSTAGRFVFK